MGCTFPDRAARRPALRPHPNPRRKTSSGWCSGPKGASCGIRKSAESSPSPPRLETGRWRLSSTNLWGNPTRYWPASFPRLRKGVAPAGPAQRRAPVRLAQGTATGPEPKGYLCAQDGSSAPRMDRSTCMPPAGSRPMTGRDGRCCAGTFSVLLWPMSRSSKSFHEFRSWPG